jgi:outer membrane lipoprotein LolB
MLLLGCAHPTPSATPMPPAASSAAGPWRGRLALQVQADPPSAYYASFELSGSPRAGSLLLLSPLGMALAQLRWDGASATLDKDGQSRTYATLDELLAEVTGAALPVAALFDWLQGRATVVQGWSADLSRLDEGRLSARRAQPAPAAELRVALDPS